MPEQNERPRPHGDPLEEVVDTADSHEGVGAGAAPASGEPRGDRLHSSDRADGRGSDANGIPAFDEADGEMRKKLYRDGAVLVSKID